MSRTKNTEKKEKIKTGEKVARSITNQKQLKDVKVVTKVLEQQSGVTTKGSRPSTYTKIQLRNGTVKETYGERYGRPDGSA
tara:strand:- start:482 stop:724 length:243 start_codon:yes stop_codon:yes gene_type:complete